MAAARDPYGSTGVRTTAAVRYACEYDTSGYAVAARRCLLAMHDAGIDVRWQPLVNVPGGRVPSAPPAEGAPDLAALYREPEDGEIAVVHSVPLAWWRAKQELGASHMIGHTVWEADRLPTRWLTEMDVADEFWVPTAWNQRVFSEAFRRPVHVVPHAVSSDVPTPPPVELPDDVFVVTVVSAWDWRKRPDLAIEAFLRAFSPDDDVLLVIKAPRLPVAWPWRQHVPTAAHVAHVLHRHGRRPPVRLDTGDWTHGEVLGLLRRTDCFLSTTASEGWGLGAFDAACQGTPVLITGYGGQVEWLGEDYPGLLPYTMVPAVHPDATLFEPDMRWAEVDTDATVDALRALYDERVGDLQTAAAALAPALRARYDPREVGERVRQVLPRRP